MSLADEFFADECDAHVQKVLLDEIAQRRTGSRHFTFNRFNVNFDMDGGIAVIEDELDPASEEVVALSEFAARLRG